MAHLRRRIRRAEKILIPSAPGVEIRHDRGQVVIVVNTDQARPEDVAELFPARCGRGDEACDEKNEAC